MDSHVQMPKSILKSFEDSKHFLYYVDLSEQDQSIKQGHAKSLNAEKDYYSQSTENYLNQTIETHLYDLRMFIANTNNSLCTIPQDIIDKGFIYLFSLLARSKSLLKNFDFLTPDSFVQTTIPLSIHKQLLRDTHSMSIAKNDTKNTWVLPTGGIIQINRTDFICPLSPSDALYFYNSEVAKSIHVSDDETIERINLNAFRTEYNNDRRYIVSPNRNQLEDLLQKWKNSHKHQL